MRKYNKGHAENISTSTFTIYFSDLFLNRAVFVSRCCIATDRILFFLYFFPSSSMAEAWCFVFVQCCLLISPSIHAIIAFFILSPLPLQGLFMWVSIPVIILLSPFSDLPSPWDGPSSPVDVLYNDKKHNKKKKQIEALVVVSMRDRFFFWRRSTTSPKHDDVFAISFLCVHGPL